MKHSVISSQILREALRCVTTALSRGRGRSTSMMRSIRPGRGVITTTRSASATASAMPWVMKISGMALLQPELLEIDPHLLARQRIERAEGLVHHQKRRIVDQRAHDRDALAHAARKLARACRSMKSRRPTLASSFSARAR